MTKAQQELVDRARRSLDAASLLFDAGHHGFAASRAYYAMFYVAEAFLAGKHLSFSKHSAVHSAFGEHFSKTGAVPAEFHGYLIKGMETRHAGDYDDPDCVTPEAAQLQIDRARQFIVLAEEKLK
ncbi:MAG: HEPN domain-containing protein [candidate division WOR-3 bacterium]|nr:MAG: HEPN domain-containing protein [candidate division WOR-3 bacterium]